MVDLISLVVVLVIVLIVFLRKSSAGIALFGLLSGVLLDQLLSSWITQLVPAQSGSIQNYIPIIVHLLITFTPVVAILVAVKVPRHNPILSLLSSLALGLLAMYFGLKIVADLPVLAPYADNSGLFTFLDPFQNLILSASAVLALLEVIFSHNRRTPKYKRNK